MGDIFKRTFTAHRGRAMDDKKIAALAKKNAAKAAKSSGRNRLALRAELGGD